MNTDIQTLIVMAVIGIIAGFLASLVVGGPDNLIQYLIAGVLGAFAGGFLLSALGVNLGIGNPLVSQIITATIGAIVLIILARLIL